MAFQVPKINYTGKIKEVSIGSGPHAIKVGGESCYPFHLFEGAMPNPPRVAFEVWDYPPEEWQEWAVAPYKDVINDPVAWAKKSQDAYGAELIALLLKSADPNGMNRDVEQVVAAVKSVADAITVPLLVWGCVNDEKDAALLRRVAELCEGKNIAIGPLVEKNYKQVGAMAIGYNQVVMASTPIDVNLAKQLNILLGNLGMPEERMLIDPTTGGLGYGLEYSYSVMERDRMAALTQEDDKLQLPIINYVGQEVWKVKECKQTNEEAPHLGDQTKRGILMEAITAVDLLLAGSDLLIMRHPQSVKMVKSIIQELAG